MNSMHFPWYLEDLMTCTGEQKIQSVTKSAGVLATPTKQDL